MPARHALLIGINRYPNIRGADLEGCRNDVALVESLLLRRFRFPADNIEVLLDEQATQRGIREGFRRLSARVEAGDVAFVHYAGHGSRLRDPLLPERIIESLVPHDSGRAPLAPNRDILDREVDEWVRTLDAKRARAILVLDCCHSGSVTRDVAMGMAAPRSRQIPPDYRDPKTSYEGVAPARRDLIAAARKRLSGWLSEAREALVLAACRAEEKACEHVVTVGDAIVRHGAMTYFLGQALARARPASSWARVFESIAPKITAAYPLQHPLLEGRPWPTLFPDDTWEDPARARRHEPAEGWGLLTRAVAAVDGDEITLAGGAAHGLVAGARWDIYPAEVVRPGPDDEPVAIVQLTRVEACSARGVIHERRGGPVEPGARAIERSTPPQARPLAVHLDLPEGPAKTALARELASSPVLTVIDPFAQPAELRVRLVPARSVAVDGDPCPLLGPVRQSSWALLGADGRLAARLVPVDEDAPSVMLGALESVARFRRFMGLEGPRPDSALARAARLEVRRGLPSSSTRGRPRFVEARADPRLGAVVFEAGDLADLVIHNDGAEDVYVSLLEFGTDLSTRLMLPYLDVAPYTTQSRLLRAGASLSVARYFECDEGLLLHLPEGFPWAAEPGSEADTGRMTFKLLVTRVKTDFSSVVQGGTRSGKSMHPLERELAALGSATRSFIPRARARRGRPEEDWAVVTRSVVVRRPPERLAIDPVGAPVVVTPGITVASVGLSGAIRAERGAPARTRDLEEGAGDSRELFDEALRRTGARAVATIELDARAEVTRSLESSGAAPHLALTVEHPGPGWTQVVLVRDGDGFSSWVLPERGADDEASSERAPQRFTIPGDALQGEQDARSLLGALGRHVLRILAVRLTERLGERGASAVGRWEESVRPYCLRSFTAADFREPSPRTRDVVAGARVTAARELDAAGWRRLSAGPALLLVHGTNSDTAASFAELDPATVDALHERYGGRVFAFEHPTLSRDPEQNVDWLLEQVAANLPAPARLELDVLGYSRGGVLCRALAAWAPQRSGGRVVVRKLVSVGAPHRGTPLAKPEHLGTFLSIWTNALNLVPIPVGPDVVAGVLELVKEAAVGTAKELAGLRALTPKSAALARLRAAEEARVEAVERYAISSHYGRCAARREDALRRRLRALACGPLARVVFKEPSDLVVPTRGVYEDEERPRFTIPETRRLVLGQPDGDGVDHMTYFADPQVRARLLEWLG